MEGFVFNPPPSGNSNFGWYIPLKPLNADKGDSSSCLYDLLLNSYFINLRFLSGGGGTVGMCSVQGYVSLNFFGQK